MMRDKQVALSYRWQTARCWFILASKCPGFGFGLGLESCTGNFWHHSQTQGI